MDFEEHTFSNWILGKKFLESSSRCIQKEMNTFVRSLSYFGFGVGTVFIRDRSFDVCDAVLLV